MEDADEFPLSAYIAPAEKKPKSPADGLSNKALLALSVKAAMFTAFIWGAALCLLTAFKQDMRTEAFPMFAVSMFALAALFSSFSIWPNYHRLKLRRDNRRRNRHAAQDRKKINGALHGLHVYWHAIKLVILVLVSPAILAIAVVIAPVVVPVAILAGFYTTYTFDEMSPKGEGSYLEK